MKLDDIRTLNDLARVVVGIRYDHTKAVHYYNRFCHDLTTYVEYVTLADLDGARLALSDMYADLELTLSALHLRGDDYTVLITRLVHDRMTPDDSDDMPAWVRDDFDDDECMF